MQKVIAKKYENHKIGVAFDEAIANYICARKEKVPEFVKKHFSFKGALRLNKQAVGADFVKTPLNMAWSIPLLSIRASSSILKKLGAHTIANHMDNIPSGFQTNVQKEINWLIFTELLELPYSQKDRVSYKDALLAEILDHPRIAPLFSLELSKINAKSKKSGFRAALGKNLAEYARSRTAAADLAGNIIALSAGTTALGKMTPGSLTAGNALASFIAHEIAASNFILGPTLGGVYYATFPAAASMGLVVASTGAVLLTMAVVASFSGIITDPIQSRLGIHKRRLFKLIDCLYRQLRGLDDSRLKISDQYYARVFDIFDLLKRAAQTFV